MKEVIKNNRSKPYFWKFWRGSPSVQPRTLFVVVPGIDCWILVRFLRFKIRPFIEREDFSRRFYYTWRLYIFFANFSNKLFLLQNSMPHPVTSIIFVGINFIALYQSQAWILALYFCFSSLIFIILAIVKEIFIRILRLLLKFSSARSLCHITPISFDQ